MLLHVQWHVDAEHVEVAKVAKTVGSICVWLNERDDATESAVRLLSSAPASYIAPERISCVGNVYILGEVLTGTGVDPVLSVVPVPRQWLDARHTIEKLLASCGLRGVFRARTLSVSGRLSPGELLRRSGIVFLALDNDAKSQLSITQLSGAQQLARRVFGPPGRCSPRCSIQSTEGQEHGSCSERRKSGTKTLWRPKF